MKLIYPPNVFKYKYLSGPVDTIAELESATEGNCRFALQLYFYRIHNIFFKKHDIYLPGGYKTWGDFIYKEEPTDFKNLHTGDVIFAENIKNKVGEKLDKSLKKYKDKDEWLYHLHSAIYLGALGDSSKPHIWHATNIEDGPTLWTIKKFCEYYKPISAKRINLIQDSA